MTDVTCCLRWNFIVNIVHTRDSHSKGFLRNNCSKNFRICWDLYPTGNYMFKVNNRNTRTKCEIGTKLTIKTPQRPRWRQCHFRGVSLFAKSSIWDLKQSYKYASAFCIASKMLFAKKGSNYSKIYLHIQSKWVVSEKKRN